MLTNASLVSSNLVSQVRRVFNDEATESVSLLYSRKLIQQSLHDASREALGPFTKPIPSLSIPLTASARPAKFDSLSEVIVTSYKTHSVTCSVRKGWTKHQQIGLRKPVWVAFPESSYLRTLFMN